MGTVDVPADRYYGAQTERSLHHFDIAHDTMPTPLIHAFGHLKRACALANQELGFLTKKKQISSSRRPPKSPKANWMITFRSVFGRPVVAPRQT